MLQAERSNRFRHAATLIGRVPGILYDDHAYFANGLSVDRYDLGQEGRQQRINGDCSPWTFAQDGFPIRGWPTAFAQHNGWLLMAVPGTSRGHAQPKRSSDPSIVQQARPAVLE